MAGLPPPTAPHPPPCCLGQPDPRALLVVVAPAAGLDSRLRPEGQPLWLLLADLMAKSLIFTYAFLGTQGNVLIAILLHASTNLFSVSSSTSPDGGLTLPLVALALTWVLAAALYVRLPRSFGDGRGSGPAVFHWSATPG